MWKDFLFLALSARRHSGKSILLECTSIPAVDIITNIFVISGPGMRWDSTGARSTNSLSCLTNFIWNTLSDCLLQWLMTAKMRMRLVTAKMMRTGVMQRWGILIEGSSLRIPHWGFLIEYSSLRIPHWGWGIWCLQRWGREVWCGMISFSSFTAETNMSNRERVAIQLCTMR